MILYVEEQILNHPRTIHICSLFPSAQKIIIKHYKNIFDRKFPNSIVGDPSTPLSLHSGWRSTEKNILVLAQLTWNAISSAPDGYGHADTGWFFKTTLNCLFNCDYCYLKWAFKNDFPVVFVNYEDIGSQIRVKNEELKKKNPDQINRWYMSDRSDTQWFDKMLGTHEYFFQLFDWLPHTMCETRTKAHDISTLVNYANKYWPANNIEIAYSLNPQQLITDFEQGTATLDRRLDNISTLLSLWYKVWLRFMPLLPVPNYMKIYGEFLEQVTSRIDMTKIYSSFAGGLLYTKSDYKKIARKEPWFQIILDELHDTWDGYYREKLEVRQNLYELFKKYISNCFVCLDQYK